MVPFKNEGLRCGSPTHVHIRADFRAAEDDVISRHPDIPTRDKARLVRLLEYPEDPSPRKKDRVLRELGTIDPDEGGSAKSALDHVLPSDQVRRLVLRARRPEVVETGRTTEIERPLAGVLEVALLHDDL